MYGAIRQELRTAIDSMRQEGLFKSERIIESSQGARITVDGKEVLNFCSNNYLGLASDERVREAACETIRSWGYGLSSVRFICGTQSIHRQLEERAAQFLGMEDAILYAACFDANGGVFEPLVGEEDAIISDELNHASIIDGVRLTKARRLRYKHSDMEDLEARLREAATNRYRIICTDGVFSMDGEVARLGEICELAERYDSLVMVDDSHATGYIGATGRGTPELCGVGGRVDILTTTFGKALGGASGGCTAGRREIIEFLRQRSRPYLFSNTLPPAVVGATLRVFDILEQSDALVNALRENARYLRERLTAAGFDVLPGDTAIIPVMLYDERSALRMADALLDAGIYVIGFAYPVVPKGRARIRVQVSAAHSREDLERAASAFVEVGRQLGVLEGTPGGESKGQSR